MLRVPLPLWGVAVGLFTVSTAGGQSPEPPADFPFEPPSSVSPNLLRQSTDELRNPLLSLMLDGELTALESAPPQAASRLQPTPQTKSSSTAPAKSDKTESCPDDAVSCEVECPSMPCFLPYAYPPPQPSCGHHSRRRNKHSCFGGQGQGYGNPYGMGGCPYCSGGQSYASQGCSGRRCHNKHGGGQQNYGYGGWGNAGCGWGGDGFEGGCFSGCYGAQFTPPPQQPCQCRKCRRHHNNDGYAGGCGNPYGNPYWGGGYAGAWGGCGACYQPPPPPPPSHHHGFFHRHSAQNCSYANNGYPGWPAYPVPGANMWSDGYNSFTDPNCYVSGCKNCCPCCKRQHHCFSHFRHGHCGHQRTPQWPYQAYPMTMPCFAMEESCPDCGFASELPAASGSSGSSKSTTK